MNEDRKKRGLANGKFFTAVAICALFLGSGNVMAAQNSIRRLARSTRTDAIYLCDCYSCRYKR